MQLHFKQLTDLNANNTKNILRQRTKSSDILYYTGYMLI